VTSTTHITIANKDELKAASETAARVLDFPDGLTRHITLTKAQWANYDALIAEGWPPEKLAWAPFDAAQEMVTLGYAADFEEEFRRCVSEMATNAWGWRADRKKNRPAN